jgi:predicted small metal-binding protein
MPERSTPDQSTPDQSTRQLNCGDVTGNCRFKAEGSNDADVLQQVMAHAKNEHGLTVTPQLVQSAKAAIRDR